MFYKEYKHLWGRRLLYAQLTENLSFKLHPTFWGNKSYHLSIISVRKAHQWIATCLQNRDMKRITGIILLPDESLSHPVHLIILATSRRKGNLESQWPSERTWGKIFSQGQEMTKNILQNVKVWMSILPPSLINKLQPPVWEFSAAGTPPSSVPLH